MVRLDIKPLSVNAAYRGRRFATAELTRYKRDIGMMTPKHVQIPQGAMRVAYVFGISSRGSDGDNLIKAFQDSIAERYGFNDNRIYEWSVKKAIVPRGKEYIEFEIAPLL